MMMLQAYTGTTEIQSLWLEPYPGGAWQLRWSDPYPLACQYAIIAGGQLLGFTDSKTFPLTMDTMSAVAGTDIHVLRCWNQIDGAVPTWTLFTMPVAGNQVALSWPAAAEADHYLLEWDQGSATWDTLATVYGSTDYTTPPLEQGDYQFRLSLVDQVGNASAAGTAITVTVDSLPGTPDTELVYAAGTGMASIAWDAVTATDLAGYRVYSNHLPGYGLMPSLVTTPLAFTTSLSFTTSKLFPGDWLFAVRAVDHLGHESDGATLALSLDASMAEISAPPATPTLVAATAMAGGEVSLEINYSDPATATLNVYVDGTLDSNIPAASTATIGPLADGSHSIALAAVTTTGRASGLSAAVTVTADGTPPTGSTTLTGALI